MKHITIPVC